MAIMIPGMEYKDLQKDFNGSVGELRLYELLEQLAHFFIDIYNADLAGGRQKLSASLYFCPATYKKQL